jgi:predicted lactoylglutathione lyase
VLQYLDVAGVYDELMSNRIDQINVVVKDVDAATQFLIELGLEIPEAPHGWRAHHRTIPTTTSLHGGHGLESPTFGIDLDSVAFAMQWGGLDPSFTGVVLNVRVDERNEVDQLHDSAQAIGGRSLKSPYDAFWGSRYAVVEGPGSVVVGLMSEPDPERRSAPPNPNSFA